MAGLRQPASAMMISNVGGGDRAATVNPHLDNLAAPFAVTVASVDARAPSTTGRKPLTPPPGGHFPFPGRTKPPSVPAPTLVTVRRSCLDNGFVPLLTDPVVAPGSLARMSQP